MIIASFRALCFTVMLCYRKEFNIEVLKKFIALQDFKGKILVDALRYIVCTFLHTYAFKTSSFSFTIVFKDGGIL